MRIQRIDHWRVSIPTPAPFYPSWIPGFPQTEVRFVLLRFRTESGYEGWTAAPAMGREHDGLGDLLGPYVLGERADDIPSIRQRIREMGYLGWRVGWLEPAMWDILGKRAGKPVYELLGGARGGSVGLYASTGEVRHGAARIAEVEARLREGFSAVKLRVHDMALEDDVRQIREVRGAVGEGPILGVDANQGWRVAVIGGAPRWDYGRALAFCTEAAGLHFKWVEEPLAHDAYDDLARLRTAVDVDVTGGELNNQGLPEFRVMLEKGSLDVYQPDAVFTGGISGTWAILEEIARAGARYSPHTWTNGVGFAVNLHLFAASKWRDATLLEFPCNPPSWTPASWAGILEEPYQAIRGRLELPTAPGLGFAIDLAKLRRFGTHVGVCSKARVALRALRDKGFTTARAIGATRDGRLQARHEALDAFLHAGGDPVRLALGRDSLPDEPRR